MLQLGIYNTLKVARNTQNGYYLEDAEANEVLLPFTSCPGSLELDSEIKVFLYKDSEDRPIATTLEPYIFLNEFAVLEAVTVNNIGAFFDWGLDGKDLFVPYSEQHQELREGENYLVYLYHDKKTDRLVGSTKKNRYLENEKIKVRVGQEVDILIYEETNLGYNVIINDMHQGLLYKNEVFEPVFIDDYVKAYVKKIRPDGKIDVNLNPIGYKAVEDNTKKLYSALIKNNKFLKINDKSDPKIIAEQLGMSKKVFKKAAGALYKKKAIIFENDGITLLLELDEFKA